jgi:hypothetical protein
MTMKKILLFIVLAISATVLYGQKSIDDLFDKYAGRDGFTTVTINGSLLRLARIFGDDNDEDALPAHITEIRILAQEADHIKVDNFYTSVIDGIDLRNYDEFMRIKKSDEDVRMLVRSDGDRFREFLLIAGGNDNALIQIKGNMTYAEAKKFSKEAEKNNGMNITQGHKNQ